MMRKGPQILLYSEIWSLLGNCLKVLGYTTVKNWNQSQAEGSTTISAQQAEQTLLIGKEQTIFTTFARISNIFNYIAFSQKNSHYVHKTLFQKT